MEHDDRPFSGLLGGGGTPPGVDELRSIVARSRRHQRRRLAVGAVLALAIGGGGGYAVAHGSTAKPVELGVGSDPSTTVAAPFSAVGASPEPVPAPASSSVAPLGGPEVFTRLFTRTAGAVTVRGFQTSWGLPAASPGACGAVTPSYQAELSTPAMVGVVQDIGQPSAGKALDAVSVGEAGQPEGDLVLSVTAATGAQVTAVQVHFASGVTDSMAPVKGWATLVEEAPKATLPTSPAQAVGTLTAFGPGGRVLASQPVTMADGGEVGVAPGGCSVACSSAVAVAPANPGPVPTTTAAPTTVAGTSGTGDAGTCTGGAVPPAVPATVPAVPATSPAVPLTSPKATLRPATSLPATPPSGAVAPPTTTAGR